MPSCRAGRSRSASLDGRTVKRLPHTAGEERDPTFSADGRRIAYASERDGHWDLYESAIVDPTSTPSRRRPGSRNGA